MKTRKNLSDVEVDFLLKSRTIDAGQLSEKVGISIKEIDSFFIEKDNEARTNIIETMLKNNDFERLINDKIKRIDLSIEKKIIPLFNKKLNEISSNYHELIEKYNNLTGFFNQLVTMNKVFLQRITELEKNKKR